MAVPSGPDLTDVVAVMAPENRRALEYIVTSAIRTNEADRQRAMAKLTAPSVANLDRIIEYVPPLCMTIYRSNVGYSTLV